MEWIQDKISETSEEAEMRRAKVEESERKLKDNNYQPNYLEHSGYMSNAK